MSQPDASDTDSLYDWSWFARGMAQVLSLPALILISAFVVLVGGAPLNEEFGKAIGADAYCRDAAVAVETAKEFLMRKHNQRAGA